MKMIYALAALVALSGAAVADDATCNTNWVNGACGVAKSDASHQEPDFIDRRPPEPEEEEAK